MKNNLKSLFLTVFKFFGYRISKFNQVPISHLYSFLDKIKPIETEFPLIRIGSNYDGGYLVPNDLKGINYCFSPGVSTNASFEKSLYDNYGIKSFLCDFSVDSAPLNCDGFDFLKKYLNSYSDNQNIDLKEWLRVSGVPNEDLILQMDIEGFEYDVLAHCSIDILKQFRIIIIEFHDLDKIFSLMGYKLITSVFNKLLDEFYVVHYHPNNCSSQIDLSGLRIFSISEFTFIRKDRVSNIVGIEKLPNKLDMDNLPKVQSCKLPVNIFFK